MIEESLLKSNFLGRDGFRWWIGQIPPITTQAKQQNGGGWGNRYKVRILGYHPYDEEQLSSNDLPWAQVLLPTTAGSGGANQATSVKLNPGDVVFGFFLDGDNAQIPVITGCFGRTSQVPSKEFAAPFIPFTGYTNNIDRPNGTLKPDESNESNTKSQKSPRDISPDKIDRLNQKSKDKDEIPYYTGIGQKIVFANTCDDTAVKGIASEVNNLLDKVQNATNLVLNVGAEINRSVDKIKAMANNLVGQMFNSLYNALIPVLQKGLQVLYETVYAKVYAITPGDASVKAAAAHLAGVAAQTAMVPPVKELEEAISCVAAQVVNGLFGTIKDLLKSVVKNVKKFRSCAGKQFVGAFLNSVIDEILDGLSSVLDGVSKILSPAFDIANFLRSGIDVIKSVGGLFDCNQSKQKCSGLVKEWTIGCGAKDSEDENKKFNEILKGMNIAASIGKLPQEKDVEKTDRVVTDNFSGIVRTLFAIEPEDNKIFFDDLAPLKMDSLIAPQFKGATEFMQVKDINLEKNVVTVRRNYVGTAVTYSSFSKFSVIDPIEKKKLKKKVKAASFDEKYGTWDIFGEKTKKKNSKSPLGGCYTGPEDVCGSPKVSIFGGGGTGATGTAILGYFVDNTEGSTTTTNSDSKTASIIGVKIDNPGSGYRYPPFVEFIDDCGIGYGAVGRALLNDNGEVDSIYMVSIGENYPTGGRISLDEIQSSKKLYGVKKVVIKDSGNGYSPNDTGEDNFGNKYNIKVDDGKVIEASPINRIVTLELPKIKIKSDTGTGALLQAVIEPLPDFVDEEVQKVIDCI